MTSFTEDLERCLETLKNGGVILYPTDTIWGLGCDATNAEAVARIFHIKKRPDNKSLIVLVADERDVLQYVSAVDLSVFDYLESQSRPTTVIYPGAIGLAENLVSEDGSVGIRIVNDEFCRHLIKRFRKPLVSTSANISGNPAPANFREINNERLWSRHIKNTQHFTGNKPDIACFVFFHIPDRLLFKKIII